MNPTKKKEKNPIISNSYENLDERVPTKILNQKKKETKILYAENKNTSNEIPTIEKEEKKRENIKHLSYKSNEDLKGSKLLDEGFNNSVLEGDSEKITYPENQNSDLSLEKEEVQPMVSIKPQELDKPIFEKTNGEIEEEDDDDDEKENKDVNIIQNYKKSEKTGKKIKKEELIKMIYELNEVLIE